MSEHFSSIDDNRQQNKCVFSQHDVLMSAFACMYFQGATRSRYSKLSSHTGEDHPFCRMNPQA
ncbi:MAG: hypothetical protein HRT38_05675 [Alteromonadaceae bacterium]|nr:hypothetical protein [Alteromonadaceae bacterium]